MAKSDILVRAKADVSGYDANLAKARKQLERFKEDNLSVGGTMKQVSATITRAAAGFASASAVTAAALKVMKDAFGASERSVDEWGRMMESGKSLYEGFLHALNTGDISGYLSNINDIVTAARRAYDELDRLGTMRTIQAPKVSAQQTENERIRSMIMTGRYIAPTDGRRAAMANGTLLTPAQIKTLERQLQNGMNNMVKLVGNEVKQAGRAIDAVYTQQAKNLGMSVAEFRRGTSSMSEFERRVQGAANYRRWQEEHTTIDVKTGREIAPRYGNPYAQYKGWDVFRVDGEKFNNLVQLIQQRDQQASQLYATTAQTFKAINRAEGVTVSKIMSGGGGGGGKGGRGGAADKKDIDAATGSIDAQAKKVRELEAAWRAAATDDSRENYRRQLDEAQFALDKLMGKTSGIPAMNYGVADLAGSGGAAARGNWTLSAETMKRVQKYANRSEDQGNTVSLSKTIGDITGGISSIAGNIEALGLEIPQDLKSLLSGIQAVTSILTTISAIVSAIQVIAGADAIIPFAQGGIARAAGGYRVPGTRYSGDRVPALLNSGELVLNRAQQGVLASALTGSNTQQLEAVVSAEQIRFVLNNNARRRGASEYITIK
jgi:hypothetical protein